MSSRQQVTGGLSDYPQAYPQAGDDQPSLQIVYEALWTHGLEWSSNQDWQCPAHDDQNASLGVHPGDDRAVVLKCQAACTTDQVRQALGLSWSVLMQNRRRRVSAKSNDGPVSPRRLPKKTGTPTRRASSAPEREKHSRRSQDELTPRKEKVIKTREWWYEDDDCRRCVGVRRYDLLVDGREQKKIRQIAVNGVAPKDAPYNLYNLKAVKVAAAQDGGGRILLVAGEPSVDRALEAGLGERQGGRAGFVVTTMRGGDGPGKWKEHYGATLAGVKSVLIVADRDLTGYKHALAVGFNLAAHGVSHRIMLSATTGAHDDLVEHLDAGFGVRDLVAAPKPWLQAEIERLETEIADDPKLAKEAITEAYHLTDVGNAHRLVQRHGRDIRYCYPKKTWLIWNGQFWAPDDGPRIELLAKETVRAMYAEIAEIDELDARKAFASWCNSSESNGRIESMIKLARSEVAISPAELNKNDWLLCVSNGVLDTKNDELLSFDETREQFITVQAHTPYLGAEHRHLDFTHFLKTVLGGDEDLASFLQRAAYISLTGVTSDKAFINFYDEQNGNTGKSTLVTCLALALGTGYAATIDPKAFTKSHRSMDSIPAELAECDGKRLVVSDEIPSGAQLNEALLKRLCSGTGVMQFRTLFTKPWTGKVTFTIWMDGNGAPRAQTEDTAFWRRRKMVPFLHTIPPSTQIGDWAGTMSADDGFRAAVLGFAMRGREGWHELGGMGSCEVVERATAAIRDEGDPCDDYFADCVEFGDSSTKEVFNVLYDHYVQWCHTNSRDPLKGNNFKLLLPRKGAFKIEKVINVRGKRGRGYGGVRLLRP